MRRIVRASLSKRINELLVLAVLDRGPAHGYQIALSVEERTGGAFSFQHGTLYPILHRLETDGHVRGTWSGEGRRRKTYALTDAGRAELAAGAAELERQFRALLALLGGNHAA
ncbi:PadR family transcriptional regulator [Candidatus Palauibacter sp.]|uniref:PadR family transcriptional regulator n=1 Tax=Candidatus Palauibacter sp. TaxID=3101350 RepID=UPI003B526A24